MAMPFKDFIAQFEYDPENFDVEKFKADALKEYGNDEGDFTAKIDQLTASNTSIAGELKSQKVANYDLLTKIPASESSTPDAQRQEQTEAEEISIDDLFGSKESA